MTKIKTKPWQNLTEFALALLTTALVTLLISGYCDLFSDLGLAAKSRLLHDPLLAFFATPILFWISAFTCRKLAPNAAGNVLNHIHVALENLKKQPNSSQNKVGISPLLNLRTLATNGASSLISTFGGGALGREAPSVYISTSIFAVVASKLRLFLPKINLEKWIIIGGAAGLTIAFNAPIAGLFYAAEKLIRSRSKEFLKKLAWTGVVVFTAIITLHQIAPFTKPLFATNKIDFELELNFALIAPIAVICGLTAFLLKKINNFFYQKFAAIKSGFWHLIPISGGLAVFAISLYAGIYSFSGGIKTAQDVLADQVLLSEREVFGRIANTILTFVSGCAGGLVAPAIAIGAGLGSIFSQITDCLDAKIFILASMAAFLSPFLGLPFAAAMVIVETTNQPIAAFPFLLLPAIISFTAEKLANR